MPDEDGYSFVRTLRAREARANAQRVPVVALTALAGEDDRRRALEAGFDLHVSKPVDPDEVASIVAMLAASPARIRQEADRVA